MAGESTFLTSTSHTAAASATASGAPAAALPLFVPTLFSFYGGFKVAVAEAQTIMPVTRSIAVQSVFKSCSFLFNPILI